jgi:hypothetical protein
MSDENIRQTCRYWTGVVSALHVKWGVEGGFAQLCHGKAVLNEKVYEYRMSDSFVPFRRDIWYYDCKETGISKLLERLSFTRGNKNWGYLFRLGHFEISFQDLQVIAEAMLDDAGGNTNEFGIQ